MEAELEQRVATSVIKPVCFSEWASPIVPILKRNGQLRICGDFKQTVYPVLQIYKYPIPNIDDLYSKVSGGRYFTRLDLSDAYLQVPLDEESQKLTTINTPEGLFMYTQLCFGIASSPGVFQRIIDQLIQGIPRTVAYLDDTLISGRTMEEHNWNLHAIFMRLQDAGLRLKGDKCEFRKSSISYLGHRIDSEGIHPTQDKVNAICKAPTPKNVSELRSFLAFVNYYHWYLNNISTVLAPLYRLLQKGIPWKWGPDEAFAFKQSKGLLMSTDALVHYITELKLIMMVDASPVGVGAVLLHIMKDGSEKPIYFASKALSKAEQNYVQIEREGLAVIFGVSKFHKYIYGWEFTIITDHKPLLRLFKEDRAISPTGSARAQRWALVLASYHYQLVYKPGSKISNGDELSRLPIEDYVMPLPCPEEVVLSMSALDLTPVTSKIVAFYTSRDPMLSQVCKWILHGWPEKRSLDFQPYTTRKNELSEQLGCVLWGSKVVIPAKCWDTLLKVLHESHPGISWMKSLARSHIWWPKIDADIEL